MVPYTRRVSIPLCLKNFQPRFYLCLSRIFPVSEFRVISANDLARSEKFATAQVDIVTPFFNENVKPFPSEWESE